MMDYRVLLLGTGCALFGALILLEPGTSTRYPAPPPAAPPKADIAPAAVSDSAPEPKELVSAILGRPLFSASRRPPQAADPSNNFELGGARLTGIVITPGQRLAIFEIKGSKPLVLNEGDTVSGWRVDSIAPAEVSLVGPAGLQTLQPKPDPTRTVANLSTAPAPAQPAPNNGTRPRGPAREPQH